MNVYHVFRRSLSHPWPRFVALTVACAAAASCGRATPAEQPPAASAPVLEVTLTAEQIAHGAVRWSSVQAALASESLDLPGRLRLDGDHTASLSAPARGRVVAIRANVGDAVTAGQVLVVLQSEDAAARRSDLTKANAELVERQSALSYARSARERAERLLGLKAASVQDVERSRTDEATAEARVAQAQAAIEQARSALAVLQVDDTTGQIHLTSPLTGVVVSREVAIGAVVDPGVLALVVTEPTALWLEFGAPESVANGLTSGRALPFKVASLDGTFHARVLRVDSGVDPATRLVTVRAAVRNADRRLRSEMFVTVRAEVGASKPAVSIPHDAVQLIDERSVVFVARPGPAGGATFVRRDVQTGTTVDGQTPVLSGLAAGEVVVTAGAFAVRSEFTRGSMPAGE